VVVIPLMVGFIALHFFLTELFESEFDQLKLVKRMWAMFVLLIAFMLTITIWETEVRQLP
jgi:hypothetical protein